MQLEDGETRDIECDEPITGRYVTIHLNGSEHLQICGFMVFAEQEGKFSYANFLETVQIKVDIWPVIWTPYDGDIVGPFEVLFYIEGSAQAWE